MKKKQIKFLEENGIIYKKEKLTYQEQKDYKKCRKYGLTLDEYYSLIEKQKSFCAICENPCNSLNIDHCHDTGFVRGLLCWSCNVGLGHFKNNIKSLNKAIKYLETFKTSRRRV